MTSSDRKPHRDRWRPDPKGLPGLQLTERDIAIAELTYRFRYITSDDLVLAYKAVYPEEVGQIGQGTGLKRRLMRLFHAEIINRAPATKVLSARQERNWPYIYHLGRRAIPLLVQRGHDRRHLEPATKSPSAMYLEHHLGTSAFHLSLLMALADRSDASLAWWINESTDTRLRWSEQEGGVTRKFSCNPDAMFAIDDAKGRMYNFFDYDTGTMSRRRLRWKIDSYMRLWKRKLHTGEPYNLPGDSVFRVFFATTSMRRVEQLRKIARDADPRGRGGLKIFWVACIDDYETDASALLKPIWHLPSGKERFSILDRDVKTARARQSARDGDSAAPRTPRAPR